MKSLAFALVVLACWGPVARAQVSVEVDFADDTFLAHETCMAEIKIANFSGRPVKFSAKADWLDLVVESHQGYIVEKIDEIPEAEEFVVPSSGRGIRRVDLSKVFNIARTGRYGVTAMVHLPELNLDVASPKKSFNVGGGTRIWEQSFGVPGAAGQSVETRRYTLIQANAGKRLALYLRVSDENDERVYRVFPLGGLLTFSRPEAQVDREGRLHVLYQTGAKMYSYNVVDPDGKLLIRQTHQIGDTRPGLRSREGEIKVVGGFRMKSDYDVPPPEAPQRSAEQTNLTATATNSAPATTNSLPAPPAPPAQPAR